MSTATSARLIFITSILAVTMGLLAVPQVTQAVSNDRAYAVASAD